MIASAGGARRRGLGLLHSWHPSAHATNMESLSPCTHNYIAGERGGPSPRRGQAPLAQAHGPGHARLADPRSARRRRADAELLARRSPQSRPRPAELARCGEVCGPFRFSRAGLLHTLHLASAREAALSDTPGSTRAASDAPELSTVSGGGAGDDGEEGGLSGVRTAARLPTSVASRAPRTGWYRRALTLGIMCRARSLLNTPFWGHRRCGHSTRVRLFSPRNAGEGAACLEDAACLPGPLSTGPAVGVRGQVVRGRLHPQGLRPSQAGQGPE
jgi:hypothetical protein